MRFLISAFLAILSFSVASAQPVYAALVTRDFSGTVTGTTAGNRFDIEVGDVFGVRATYDADLLTGIGDETLSPTSDAGLTLTIDIGPLRFEASDDSGFPLFPELEFFDGRLVDINFVAAIGEFQLIAGNGVFVITGIDDTIAVVSGSLVIPEPAALTLFGAGLAGIGLLRRRRTRLHAA